MRLDLDEIARRADRAARADIDALVAALLARAAVRADLLAIAEEARLLEFADQRAELLRGERLLQGIVARRDITLRQLVHPQHGLAREIEHHVELLAARLIAARLELDRRGGLRIRQRRHRNKRRNLRRCLRRRRAPATVLAHIDELDLGLALRLLGELAK